MRRAFVIATCTASVLGIATAGWTPSRVSDDVPIRLIIQESAPSTPAAESLVASLGGQVLSQLGIVGGFAAVLPTSALTDLQRSDAIAYAWPDGQVRMSDTPGLEEYDVLPPNRVWQDAIGLDGVGPEITGAGVTVAVLDTGITRRLDFGYRVTARVDLTPDGDGYDEYGHGTHMAGIVGGDGARSDGRWRGSAPGVTLLPVKVASWNGATDVSVVLAAMEWIAVHRDEYGIDILSLSFGTDSSQDYEIDPLDFAVERLWNAGVVIVAAAGNRGEGGSKIDKPGDDPRVITVGAADLHDTVGTADDTVALFSSRGPTQDGVAKPDLVAPGITIVSQRAPGSTIDAMRPAARLGKHHFKGTGTSQSTAMVAGVAALVLDAAPGLSPDQVKEILLTTASPMTEGVNGAGAGLVNAERAVDLATTAPPDSPPPTATPSTGEGSIDSSRGNTKPYTDLDGDGDPEQVSGEIDVLGSPFDSTAWAARPWNATAWAASPWSTLTNVSPGWMSTVWPPDSWAGLGWDENSWTAKSWRDADWNPGNWTAKSWRAAAWN
ncbi:MAG: S8 family peptidase [Actinomycetota bacterium]|nr:S8 family peptidase [Actinomycetota bacterium]